MEIEVKPYQKPLREGEFVNSYSELIRRVDYDSLYSQLVFFDSLSDMAECVDRNQFIEMGGSGAWPFTYSSFMPEQAKKGRYYSDGGYSFGKYFDTYEKTYQALKSGSVHKDLLTLIDRFKDELYNEYPELFELEMSATKKRRTRKFDFEGSEIDIDRYMTGDPQIWSSKVYKQKKAGVKIMFNGAFMDNHGDDSFVKMTVLCGCFVEVLERLNVPCEIWYAPVSISCTDALLYDVVLAKVKATNEPIDMSRILSMSMPGLWRWFEFAVEYNLMKGSHRFTSIGHTVQNCPPWISKHYNFDIVINANDGDYNIYNSFLQTINTILL